MHERYCLHLKRDLAGVADLLSKDEEVVPKTIIFCRTKNDCAKVYSFLYKSSHSYAVSMYHSSLTQATKTQVQDSFKSRGQLKCLSATVAFGMVNTKAFTCTYMNKMTVM